MNLECDVAPRLCITCGRPTKRCPRVIMGMEDVRFAGSVVRRLAPLGLVADSFEE